MMLPCPALPQLRFAGLAHLLTDACHTRSGQTLISCALVPVYRDLRGFASFEPCTNKGWAGAMHLIPWWRLAINVQSGLQPGHSR